ncbi:tRNA lysidine(34) synthetase TilS [Umboniibacter marinipuniceus]|uniref:tRNA(Ile)-lysidine synthase n=1 Tax=Umboniibacter marinipuniceus TaxID=569599 RepID=A0A3M0A5B2_9GAMM|nr:tRNA lysidine(34) synthetase TilS [Umboniibacter marinipuniceus]RMA78689.1 tRNA(Ile)-lysidine synthase [Umboniibacter marinipuniceus]
MTISQQLSASLAAVSASRWVVAWSGGADSTALLHALIQRKLPQPILAIHVNHQLQPLSSQWSEQCRQLAAQWNIEFRAIDVSVVASGKGIEAAAREARYEAFEALLELGDVLLQGHHADDQLETLVFRTLRGEGLVGLSGIPAQRGVGKGRLLRPLLSCSRSEIEAYASDNELSVIEDPSNHSRQFSRNQIRHDIIPLLKRFEPMAAKHAASSARYLQQSRDALVALFSVYHPTHLGRDRWGYWCEPLDIMSDQSVWVHHWISVVLKLSISGKLVQEIVKLLSLEVDRRGEVKLGASGCFFSYEGKLYFVAASSATWSNELPTRLVGDNESYCVSLVDSGLRLKPDCYEIGLIEAAGKILPAGRKGRRKLKKYYQDIRVPWFARGRLPGLFIRGELAAIADVLVCEGYQAQEGEVGWRLHHEFD